MLEHLLASALTADPAAAVTTSEVTFTGSVEAFEERVKHALGVALHSMPYYELVEIALELQRNAIEIAGFQLISRTDVPTSIEAR